jgi:hypothetical protein
MELTESLKSYVPNQAKLCVLLVDGEKNIRRTLEVALGLLR